MSDFYKTFFEHYGEAKSSPIRKAVIKDHFQGNRKTAAAVADPGRRVWYQSRRSGEDEIIQGAFPGYSFTRIDENTYVELKKIGVNLNQLTRHANSGKLPLGIDKTLAALLRQEEKIIRLLLKDDRGSEDR